MTIAQLVYASKPSTESRINVEDLLVTSRAKNKLLHVTGYLCFLDHRSAIEFLSEVAGGAARRTAAKKDAAT